MESNGKNRFSLYLIMVVAMTFAGLQLATPMATATTCCTYGEECGERAICCVPNLYERPCSQGNPNYCRRVCGPNPN